MNREHPEDSYPLSPMQQGMLFHSLYAPQSGMYVQQLICGLQEDLQVAAFERAWQRVVARHPALRTRFRWDGGTEALPGGAARGQPPLGIPRLAWGVCWAARQPTGGLSGG